MQDTLKRNPHPVFPQDSLRHYPIEHKLYPSGLTIPWGLLADESLNRVDLSTTVLRIWIEQGFQIPGVWAGSDTGPGRDAWRKRTCAACPRPVVPSDTMFT